MPAAQEMPGETSPDTFSPLHLSTSTRLKLYTSPPLHGYSQPHSTLLNHNHNHKHQTYKNLTYNYLELHQGELEERLGAVRLGDLGRRHRRLDWQ